MKALSLTPPWSEMILHHGKRIENRERWKGCSYRGPILLHAAKGIGTRADFDSTCETILDILDGNTLHRSERLSPFATLAQATRKRDSQWVPTPQMLRAGIVGRARIVDVIQPNPLHRHSKQAFSEWAVRGGKSEIDAREAQRRWWFGGFALVLDDVEPLPFVRWRGELGLFEVPDDYATRAAEALKGTP